MTTPAKRKALLAILTAILGAVTMPFLHAAWTSKVSTSTFDLYAQGVNARFERADAKTDAIVKQLVVADSIQREMTKDILCVVKKQQDRRCKGP